MVEVWASTGEHSVATVSTAEAGMATHCSWADDSVVDVPTGSMLPVTKQNLLVGWAILQENLAG